MDDVDGVIRYSLQKLEDGHSFLIPPNMLTLPSRTDLSRAAPRVPWGEIIENVGYIQLPELNMPPTARQIGEEYAQTAQREIARLDQFNPDGWVVDLRTNHGGACYPMLVGIGPLLNEGIHGYFVDIADNNAYPWGYKNGASFCNDTQIFSIEAPYRLSKEKPPIAVLTGDGTSSSGEVVLISFRGLSNVKIFGDHSDGRTTGNMTLYVTDTGDITANDREKNLTGKAFALASSVMADRNKTLYGAKIAPDFNGATSIPLKKLKEKSYRPKEDLLVRQAIGWINNQLTTSHS